MIEVAHGSTRMSSLVKPNVESGEAAQLFTCETAWAILM